MHQNIPMSSKGNRKKDVILDEQQGHTNRLLATYLFSPWLEFFLILSFQVQFLQNL